MATKKSRRPSAPRKRAKKRLKFCFVLMPFKEPFNSYYERIYKPAIRDVSLEALRADDVCHAGTIIKDIWEHTMGSQLLVAEMTGRNPNVFYELGLAHALSKPVVLLTQDLEDIPSDLKHLRHIRYDTTDPDWAKKLRAGLGKAIRETLAHPAASLALPSVVAMSREGDNDTKSELNGRSLKAHADEVFRSGYSGGRGGREFSDNALPESSRVVQVKVRHGAGIDSLQIIHETADGTRHSLPAHGGGGGEETDFLLDADEFITGITGRFGELVDSIQFITNKQRSRVFGRTDVGPSYLYQAPDGSEIVGFFGRAGARVDAIGVVVRPRVC